MSNVSEIKIKQKKAVLGVDDENIQFLQLLVEQHNITYKKKDQKSAVLSDNISIPEQNEVEKIEENNINDTVIIDILNERRDHELLEEIRNNLDMITERKNKATILTKQNISKKKKPVSKQEQVENKFTQTATVIDKRKKY